MYLRIIIFGIVAFCSSGVPAQTSGKQAPATTQQDTTKNLNKSYQITLGDFAALMLSGLSKMHEVEYGDPPVLVTYESKEKVIDVKIFGGNSRIEDARETLTKFWQFIESAHIPYISRRFNIKLEKSDYRLMYYYKRKSIIVMVGGQLIVPEQ